MAASDLYLMAPPGDDGDLWLGYSSEATTATDSGIALLPARRAPRQLAKGEGSVAVAVGIRAYGQVIPPNVLTPVLTVPPVQTVADPPVAPSVAVVEAQGSTDAPSEDTPAPPDPVFTSPSGTAVVLPDAETPIAPDVAVVIDTLLAQLEPSDAPLTQRVIVVQAGTVAMALPALGLAGVGTVTMAAPPRTVTEGVAASAPALTVEDDDAILLAYLWLSE